MTSEVLERVHALCAKASELSSKGHILRAVENLSLAAEASRALGADNLVVVDLQLACCNLLCSYAEAAAPESAADCRILAAHCAELVALLSGAVAAVERRRVAGTLLEGTCTAAEETWRARDLQQANAHLPAALCACLATLVGYEEYLRAATQGLRAAQPLRCTACLHSEICSRRSVQRRSFSPLLDTSCRPWN